MTMTVSILAYSTFSFVTYFSTLGHSSDYALIHTPNIYPDYAECQSLTDYAFLLLIHNECLELSVSLLQVIIDDDLVMSASVSVLHLSSSGGDSLLQRLWGFSTSVRQSLTKSLDGRRADKQVSSVQVGVLDRLNTLHIDVQQTLLSLLRNIFDGLNRGTIVVTRELSPFDEQVFIDGLLELVNRKEMVVSAVDLAFSRLSGGIGYRKTKSAGELSEQLLQEGRLTGAGGARDDDGSGHNERGENKQK